eukprot:3382639-Alexandrium_andersonii.AAC.1
MDLIECRSKLASLFDFAAAADLDRQTKKSAKADKLEWIQRSYEDSKWDPVRVLSRPKVPRVVSLARDSSKSFQSPAVVYADYLEAEHWAADRDAE